ncbi:MAG: hypothetical protein AAB390_04365 [Patescibacteria group bacterium]
MVEYTDLIEKKERIAVVGLGYVGLPLAVALAKKFAVIGLDLKKIRIEELQNNHDRNHEISAAEIAASGIEFGSDPEKI